MTQCLMKGSQTLDDALAPFMLSFSGGLKFIFIPRYSADNDRRSSQYDLLLAAEDKATKSLKGMHDKKNIPTRRIADITGDVAKSKTFLPFLQRAGRMQVSFQRSLFRSQLSLIGCCSRAVKSASLLKVRLNRLSRVYLNKNCLFCNLNKCF